MTANTAEPQPTTGKTEVWPLVVQDMEERNRIGAVKYGTALKTHNGRRPLVDAYQELLDLVVYLRQEVAETNDRFVNVTLTFAALRKEGQGLSHYQEATILAALGYNK